MGENFDKYYLPPDAQELIDAPQGTTIAHKDGQGLPIGISQESSEMHSHIQCMLLPIMWAQRT